jgi:hypothetical protein
VQLICISVQPIPVMELLDAFVHGFECILIRLNAGKRVMVFGMRENTRGTRNIRAAHGKTLDSPALPFSDIRRSLGLPLLNARISVCDHITARKIRARTYLERCVGFTLHTCALRSADMHEASTLAHVGSFTQSAHPKRDHASQPDHIKALMISFP